MQHTSMCSCIILLVISNEYINKEAHFKALSRWTTLGSRTHQYLPVRSWSSSFGPLELGGIRRSILVLSSLHMFAAASLHEPLTLANSDATQRTEIIESTLMQLIWTHTLGQHVVLVSWWAEWLPGSTHNDDVTSLKETATHVKIYFYLFFWSGKF